MSPVYLLTIICVAVSFIVQKFRSSKGRQTSVVWTLSCYSFSWTLVSSGVSFIIHTTILKRMIESICPERPIITLFFFKPPFLSTCIPSSILLPVSEGGWLVPSCCCTSLGDRGASAKNSSEGSIFSSVDFWKLGIRN